MRNAYIRVVNQADNVELTRYDLSEDASTETAMIFGELYRNGADWKFRAVGQGYSTGLGGHRPRLRRQRRLTRLTVVGTCSCAPSAARWSSPSLGLTSPASSTAAAPGSP